MRIEKKGLSPTEWQAKAEVRLTAYLEGMAVIIEAWAKENRTWTDRTGQARQSLWGKAETNGTKKSVSISQGISYGYYLETANDEKYAICKPAIKHYETVMNNHIQNDIYKKKTK